MMDVLEADVRPQIAESPPIGNPALRNLAWPRDQLGRALEALARFSGLRDAATGGAAMPMIPPIEASADIGNWVEWAAGHLGIEAEPVEFRIPELERDLMKACPMVLAVRDGTDLRFLLLLKGQRRTVTLIGPDLRLHRRPVETIRAAVMARIEEPLTHHFDRLLDAAKVTPGRRNEVRSAMLRERLAGQMVGGCWVLRLPASAPFLAQLTHAGVIRCLGWIVALFIGVYLVEIIGWALIGAAALEGRLGLGWLVAWFLLLLSNIPLQVGAAWLNATFALDLGRILKKRLLAGALSMDFDAIRHQGVGQLLGRVIESQAVESLALNGGMTVVVALLELMFAGWILSGGAAGYWHLLALLIWLATTLAFCWRYYRRLGAWTAVRLNTTHDLIEQMVGHRTKLAQEWPGRRDEAEDRTMQDYLALTREADDAITPIAAGAAGGWAILALLSLAPVFISGTAGPTAIAISLGGILLANRAFTGISSGITSLSQAGVAWAMVSELFRAGYASPERALVPPPAQPNAVTSGAKLIDASEVVFRYRPQSQTILQGLNLTIYQGERILLEGSSGGGKSTLAALLTGLRTPESGLLLMNGLDRSTLGSNWHQLATEAPQFHENHILTGSLAFNLLMSRSWPASAEDLGKAEALCIELGLGGLLERMPAGLMQQIGETGWQLSHGERSRVFLARALLQDAQLTILDESFAALDPETLRACLKCAIAHARTLIVIAHP
jgi:ATP-binding cassette, subfamily B, bacterial